MRWCWSNLSRIPLEGLEEINSEALRFFAKATESRTMRGGIMSPAQRVLELRALTTLLATGIACLRTTMTVILQTV
jgi:hypothetical protein